MKRSIKSLLILLVLTFSSVILPKQTTAQPNNISFQVFYDELSPYGQWIDYRNYGYVWIPDTGRNFAPYSTDGHWILTDYGWTWVSDYEWGWAPFHYGRWDYDNYYGWFWVPDNEWGPSWVNWRRADGYYGWSPMRPGISLSRNFGRPYNRYNDHWMFVRDRDFERDDLNSYYIDRRDHYLIIRNSTVINTTYIDNSRHTTYVTGPAREDVQRVTGRRINPVTIRENDRPGQNLRNGQLEIYRPQVVKNNNNQRRAAPSRVADRKDVKRPSERTGTNQQRTATPADNNGRQQQQNTTRPQNNSNAQPSQQQRTDTPANVNGRQQQQNTARPQNNSNAQPSQQQRTATPANNNGRQQQQNTARPQNNSNAQPSQQQRTATPANNNGRQPQQNTARPQNNSNAQPTQQQRSAAPANNNGRQQQQSTEQPNESRSGNEKRRND